MQFTVPLSRPDHPDDPAALLETLRTIISSGRWTQGEYAAAFERRVAEFCGSVYAVSTNSGTSALECILAALGIGPGCEVICPSYTFIATVNAVLATGANPVFADIEAETFNMSLEDAAAKRTDRTRALILVHQFGIPADGAAFAEFCSANGMVFIEDAACGLGSTYRGKAVGTCAVAGLLSFHPRKLLSTGEGGMVLTDDEDIARRARMFGNAGRGAGAAAEFVGHNYRMSEFHAALGLWAVEMVPQAMARREAIARRYDEALATIEGITPAKPPAEGVWNRQSYPVRVPPSRHEIILRTLERAGVEAGPGPFPAHRHAFIDHILHPPRLLVTETAHEETMLLPMYAALTKDMQDRVIAALRSAL